jgi:hypothetical protein
MKREHKAPPSDVEECKAKILALLDEYGCALESADEFSTVLIRDVDTNETKGMRAAR